MTQQDQTQKWSNSGSGGAGGPGRSSKKPKQKKVPQRGLGVAQLEKIRIEEQQRKEAAAAAAILPTPPSLSPSKCYLPPQLPSFHHSNQPSSSPISLHPGIPVDFFRLPPSLQNLDANKASSCTVPLEDSCTFDPAWRKLCEFEKDFVSSMSMNLPYESNHIWPPSHWTQRTQQYQQPSSSTVNVSSGNLTSPVSHYSKEPPSNQNCSSSRVPMRPEEKMIGQKRSYPFSLEVPPASSFNFKSPALTINVKPNESTSRAYGSGLNFGASSSAFREVPSCSTPCSSEPNSKKNENFNGDFLSLAPPISPSKCKSTSTFPAFHNQELPHFEPPPFQGTGEDQMPHGQQQSLHSFFPPKEEETVQTTETNKDGNCSGEKGKSVDLNLKL
ncbi:uncharacterized protein LOC114714906 isoform X1 [Neltuma alba]|uniref:uncharacterized protein LOC114714906 isoform X1 n=1 Tax=Neltuma alba TaxID=207710 RepID=UPI0010A4AAFA|nr:uncharacterized protein LOC114714906 isoform X1 [Prosopis alba]XP_028755530.1 uncharacterized protein LOC114714906 isoform X1 [Prosopis alba]XP_028755531.1 uncharacterized protein LOC114714906 isoform X1 [Prosopis alba]